MKVLAPLWPYLRPYRRPLALGIACVAGTAWIGLLAPLVIGVAIDALRAEVTSGRLARYAALLLAITLVKGVFQLLQRKILVTVSRDVERDLRDDYVAHLTRLDPGFYQRHDTGDLMARATNDLQAVRMICGPAIMYASNTVLAGVGALVLMADIDLRMTLLVLTTLPLVAVITVVLGQRTHVLFTDVQARFSDLSSKVQENLAGARVVRAYARERVEEEDFAARNAAYVDHSRRLILWNAAFNPLLQGAIGLGFAAVLWYGGRLMLDGRITIGAFVTFNLFLGRLAWPMIAVGWVINLVTRGAASLTRIRAILDTPPAIQDRPPLVAVARIEGTVVFNDLRFAYGDGPPVLDGIDLTVPAGTTVAVVGRTGAGKSTLLSLLPRLIDPPAGSLLLDGHDLRRLPLATVRGAIAMVPQETFLFSATIRENIAFGRPEADRGAVRDAARLAGLGDDLEGFPEGLETLVGERGITLSGGQKQRVALARAILRDPRLLLLDDCLSAVDTQTEETILRNLRSVFPGRTVFLVSHRISAVQMADVILVLEGGRIVERGSHDQLLARDGLYADLARKQRLEEALAAV